MNSMKVANEVKSSTVSAVEGTQILDTQVGGHRYGQNGKKLGMLDRGNGIVLKALQPPPRGTRELNLYQTVFAPACKDKDLLELRNFLPLFYGIETIDGVTFLVMNNLTYNVSKPNVLDLKMGPVSYDPEASLQKQMYENNKYPPRKQVGFQFSGMMTHDPATGSAEHYNKKFYYSITAENVVRKGLGRFFGLEHGRLRKDVVVALLQKLRRIEAWVKVQRKYTFYASSLLIVYSSTETHDNLRNSTVQQTVSTTTNTTEQCGNTADEGDKVTHNSTDQYVYSRGEANQWDSRNDSHGSSKSTLDSRTQKSCVDVHQTELPAGISASLDHHHRPTQIGQDTANSRSLLSQSSDTPGQISSPLSDSSIQHSSRSTGPSQHSNRKREMDPNSEIFAEEGLVKHPCKKRERDSNPDKPLEEDVENPEMSKVVDVEQKLDSGKFRSVCSSAAPLVEVRMIDFAHVFPSSNMDTNYLSGLQKLIGFLEQLLTL